MRNIIVLLSVFLMSMAWTGSVGANALAQCQQAKSNLQGQLTDMTASRDNFREQYGKVKDHRNRLKERLAAMTESRNKFRGMYETKRDRAKALENRSANLQEQLNTVRTRRDELITRRDQLIAHARVLTTQRDNLRKRHGELVARRDALIARSQRFEKQRDNLKSRVETLTAANTQLGTDYAECRDQLDVPSAPDAPGAPEVVDQGGPAPDPGGEVGAQCGSSGDSLWLGVCGHGLLCRNNRCVERDTNRSPSSDDEDDNDSDDDGNEEGEGCGYNGQLFLGTCKEGLECVSYQCVAPSGGAGGQQ